MQCSIPHSQLGRGLLSLLKELLKITLKSKINLSSGFTRSNIKNLRNLLLHLQSSLNHYTGEQADEFKLSFFETLVLVSKFDSDQEPDCAGDHPIPLREQLFEIFGLEN